MANMTQYDIYIQYVANLSLTIHPDDQNAMKANLISTDQQQS